ncbi:MAG: molybdopterin molybdotransferase MoeA [Lachnospiraceae bacterium]|nr:molybdopterin molybdotransferase MoeA [Lachnospiraceae bacterium]
MKAKNKTDWAEAKEKLINTVNPVGTENVSLEKLKGRILAEDITAAENVPGFDRSPYDGYVFKAEDSKGAGEAQGVTLKVIENIRAGQSASLKVIKGTAIRLMTGAKIPEGADAVCKYEDTDFDDLTVTLKREYRPGENIVKAGEDIKAGTVLAEKGSIVDTGLTGTMASLGITRAEVFKRPVAGIISTGDEVVDIDASLPVGRVRNSNRYTIASALSDMGIDSVYLGHSGDAVGEMKKMILKGLDECDLIISTGGVSAGDFDIVPDAMEEAGFTLLIHGVRIKPGMACAYGVRDDSLMLALSGNPASSLTNLQCICMPALRKKCGLKDFEHKMIKMRLEYDFKKTGPGTRFIRGQLKIKDGEAIFEASGRQGNVVISSAIGCNAYGIVNGGTGPLKAGDMIYGFITG